MLKQLMLQKRLETAKAALQEHLAKGDELRSRRQAYDLRTAELEAAVNEITTESTDEERTTVEEAITAHENEGSQLTKDETEFETETGRLIECVTDIETELSEIEERTRNANKPTTTQKTNTREDESYMENRTKFFGMTMEQRNNFVARDDIKEFLTATRSRFSAARGETRGLKGGEVAVPTIMLEVIRENISEHSKLIKYVRLRKVSGKARQTVIGEVPEAVWSEATKTLNELDMSLNALEVDAFKLGGVISIPNSVLEDGDDINLAAELMHSMAESIGKGIDRAIPYGTGVKMPLGFITRLTQTEKPADYPEDAPEWKDLSKTHIITLDISGKTGVEFFAALIKALGVAKPKDSVGAPFWIMTRQTHLDIMAKALAFNAAAALVAGMNNTMPIIGGEIIELDESIIPDNHIGGGYGDKYLLAERDGAYLGTSEHAKFVEDQTVIKATNRYDGEPIFAESFVLVSFDNTAPTVSSKFPKDYANDELGILTVESAEGTESGTTAITVDGDDGSGTLAYRIAGQPVNVKNGGRATGFTVWDGVSDITAENGSYITVVQLDDNKRIIAAGSTTVLANA